MTELKMPARWPRLIFVLFWGSILLNLTLPWGLLALFEVSAHRRTVMEAFRHVSLHFFSPGNHYFLVGLLSAAPFMVCAVFLLFHLNGDLEPPQFSRRLSGVVGSLLLMFGVNFWTHLSALLYPDAQGALVFFFLPYILLVLIPLGYGMGRLVLGFIHLIRRGDEEPA